MAQTFPLSADVAKRAVVNVSAVLQIVEKIADFAKVFGHFDVALFTILSHGLNQRALHALHFFGVVSIHRVVGIIVVAKATREGDVATYWNDFALAVVVFAAEAIFVFVVCTAAAVVRRDVYHLFASLRRRASVANYGLIRRRSADGFLFVRGRDIA